MKVIIIGASGKIGSRVAERLSGKYEVMRGRLCVTLRQALGDN